MATLLDHLRRLHEHDRRAGRSMCEALSRAERHLEDGGVSAETASFTRAVEIFAHVQAARQMWLHRIDPRRESLPEDGLFPSWSAAHARAECERLDESWRAFVEGLSEGDLDRVVSYGTTEGARVSSTMADILTHVATHAFYHRGQMASLLSKIGVGAPAGDFILFDRRPVGSDAGAK